MPPPRWRPGGRPCATRRVSRNSAAEPHSAERITSGSAREVNPWNRYSASALSTKMPTRDTTPATTAAPTARRRKYSTIGSSSSRFGVPHQVGRGEERADRHRHHPAEDRGGVDPAVDGIARLAAGRHPTRCDAAGDGAEAVRDQHRGRREQRAERPPVAGAQHRVAEREARAAQHDAERRDGEGHEQREGDRRVGLGEARPEDDEAEDQPHVVGLPHRPDRVVDHPPGAVTALGPAGDEVPEPGPEVRAAEHGVGGDPHEEDERGGGAHGTGTGGSSRSGAPSVGP